MASTRNPSLNPDTMDGQLPDKVQSRLVSTGSGDMKDPAEDFRGKSPFAACTIMLKGAAELEERIKQHNSLQKKDEYETLIRDLLFTGRQIHTFLQRMQQNRRMQQTKVPYIIQMHRQVCGVLQSLPRELTPEELAMHEKGHLPYYDELLKTIDEDKKWGRPMRRVLRVTKKAQGEGTVHFSDDPTNTHGYDRRSDFFGEFFINDPYEKADVGEAVFLEPNPEREYGLFFHVGGMLLQQNEVVQQVYIMHYFIGKERSLRFYNIAEYRNEFSGEMLPQSTARDAGAKRSRDEIMALVMAAKTRSDMMNDASLTEEMREEVGRHAIGRLISGKQSDGTVVRTIEDQKKMRVESQKTTEGIEETVPAEGIEETVPAEGTTATEEETDPAKQPEAMNPDDDHERRPNTHPTENKTTRDQVMAWANESRRLMHEDPSLTFDDINRIMLENNPDTLVMSTDGHKTVPIDECVASATESLELQQCLGCGGRAVAPFLNETTGKCERCSQGGDDHGQKTSDK
jgi:hypothetical protein